MKRKIRSLRKKTVGVILQSLTILIDAEKTKCIISK